MAVSRDDFHFAPSYKSGVFGSGERLEGGLLRGEPGREVHGGPRARHRVGDLVGREEPVEDALALIAQHALHTRDVDEIDAESCDHDPFLTTNSLRRSVLLPLRAITT